jgi:hypothetical protein
MKVSSHRAEQSLLKSWLLGVRFGQNKGKSFTCAYLGKIFNKLESDKFRELYLDTSRHSAESNLSKSWDEVGPLSGKPFLHVFTEGKIFLRTNVPEKFQIYMELRNIVQD